MAGGPRPARGALPRLESSLGDRLSGDGFGVALDNPDSDQVLRIERAAAEAAAAEAERTSSWWRRT